MKFVRWLAEDGPTSPKHVLWPHPVTSFIVHYTVVTTVVFVVHDLMVSFYHGRNNELLVPWGSNQDSINNNTLFDYVFHPRHCLAVGAFSTQSTQQRSADYETNDQKRQQRQLYATFIMTYAIGMFLWRMYSYHHGDTTKTSTNRVRKNTTKNDGNGAVVISDVANCKEAVGNNNNKKLLTYVVFYEFQFLCNVTLIISSLSLWTNRPIVATGFCVAVGIDQLLWYVDLLGYFLFTRYVTKTHSHMQWDGSHYNKPQILSLCKAHETNLFLLRLIRRRRH